MNVQRVKLTFSKTGDIRFISHLDLVRLFQRATRRADLPVALSQGFNPHLKISITRALKLGVASESEEAVVQFDRPVPSRDIVTRLNAAMPEGVRIINAEELR